MVFLAVGVAAMGETDIYEGKRVLGLWKGADFPVKKPWVESGCLNTNRELAMF